MAARVEERDFAGGELPGSGQCPDSDGQLCRGEHLQCAGVGTALRGGGAEPGSGDDSGDGAGVFGGDHFVQSSGGCDVRGGRSAD